MTEPLNPTEIKPLNPIEVAFGAVICRLLLSGVDFDSIAEALEYWSEEMRAQAQIPERLN
jgi:hypothetical protein